MMRERRCQSKSVNILKFGQHGNVVKGPASMSADHFQSLEKFESGLWKIADNLRANSNLASNEYFMPIMGLIFLAPCDKPLLRGAGRD